MFEASVVEHDNMFVGEVLDVHVYTIHMTFRNQNTVECLTQAKVCAGFQRDVLY